MRPEELVGRAHVEVRAEGRGIHRGMSSEVDTVDVHERSDLVRPRGDRSDRRNRAEEIGCRRHGDQPRAVVHDLGEIAQVELGGVGIHPQPADDHPASLGGLDPRPHIAVVIELRDHDLVTHRPRLGQGARDVVRDLGRAASVHDPARVGAEQVGDRLAKRGDRVVGIALARDRGAPVGQRTGQRAGDRVAHHPRESAFRPDRRSARSPIPGRGTPCATLRRPDSRCPALL